MFPVNGAVGLTVLRVIVAIIFLVHGYQKIFLLGLGSTGSFFGSVGIPLPGAAALLVASLELLGGLMILLGVLARSLALILLFDPPAWSWCSADRVGTPCSTSRPLPCPALPAACPGKRRSRLQAFSPAAAFTGAAGVCLFGSWASAGAGPTPDPCPEFRLPGFPAPVNCCLTARS
jgi:hypothetical protein